MEKRERQLERSRLPIRNLVQARERTETWQRQKENVRYRRIQANGRERWTHTAISMTAAVWILPEGKKPAETVCLRCHPWSVCLQNRQNPGKRWLPPDTGYPESLNHHHAHAYQPQTWPWASSHVEGQKHNKKELNICFLLVRIWMCCEEKNNSACVVFDNRSQN